MDPDVADAQDNLETVRADNEAKEADAVDAVRDAVDTSNAKNNAAVADAESET